MKNLDKWEELIKETMDKDIYYNDKVSVFVEHDSGYVVIENEGREGLQMQFRKSLDHSDVTVADNIVIHGKIISELTPSNYHDVKSLLAEFVDKL